MKKRWVFTGLLMLVLGLISTLQSQDFSLQQARTYALENNKTVKNAASDVMLADAKYKESVASGLPKIEGSLDYMTNFGYEFAFNLGGGNTEPPEIDYSKLDLGDLEVLKLIEAMSSTGSPTIRMSDQASANVQVSQLIFSGQYWVGLEMARLGQVMSEKGLQLTELEIKDQVTSTYYLILVTRELVRVIEINQQNLSTMFSHTENLYNVGLAEKTDVDQMKVNLSQLENSRRAMERNLLLSYNMFRMLLGLEPGSEVNLTDELNPILAEVEKQMIPSDQWALADNVNYQMLQLQDHLGDKKIELQKWAYAPTLVGFYSYKEKILASAFDLSPNHAAGFTMTIPIYSGGARQAQMTQALIEKEKSSRSLSLLEDQLALQQNQLNYNLTNAYENFKMQRENIGIAQEVFESIRHKYEQGMLSSLELTQANSNYLQAENNYLSSALELLKSKLALDKLYNTL